MLDQQNRSQAGKSIEHNHQRYRGQFLKCGFPAFYLVSAASVVRLSDLVKLNKVYVDLSILKEEKLVGGNIKSVKIIGSASPSFSMELVGLKSSSGARKIIEKSHGVFR